MKKTFILTSLLWLGFASVQADSTWRESRTVLLTPNIQGNVHLLYPGQSVTEEVNLQLTNVPARRFLRVIGGIKMPEPYEERGEEMFRRAEFLIDDNLDSICRKRDKYALYFKGKNDNFERHAYYRISGSLLEAGTLTVTLPVVKKENLTLDDKGDFGLQIGLYYKKEGRAADDIYDEPDSVLYVPVPEGNSRYQRLTETFVLPEKIACAFIQLGGTHFSGECWVEAPRFRQGRKELSIPFTKYAQRPDQHNYWVGCNLSTRSWPMWKLEADGKTIFEGNMFDRASNVADFYIPLPESLPRETELKLHLVKEDHRAAFPYELRGLELIEETARDFEVISVPRYVAKNASFGVLLETNEPNVLVRVQAEGAVTPSVQECLFEKPGLHVVEMRAKEAGQPIHLSFAHEGRKEEASVQQVIDKESEKIYLSSGDEIYIDKQYVPYDYFFKWYLSSRVGNWYHFRPSYQWSGFRVADSQIIGHYTHLLDQLKVPYAWQVEGRTLASKKINPSLEVLASPMFRGKQAHENDGGYYYWGHFKYQGLFSDMAAKARPYGGIFAKHRPIFTDHGTFVHYDPAGIANMEEGAQLFVNNLRYSKGESTRHTGPSTMFRYFYQAGYNWLGAEQMYGPEETILSSLRGASRAYARPEYGSLHAMQWGSSPFTDPKHSLRLYMSLAVAYMHGSSHMNTEEALWTDEYVNDRYSKSGKEHLFAQHQVLDFIETHSRRGELKSNIAVIQGRNDAWKSFGRGNLWSQESDQWRFGKANESFDLMRVFYPHNVLNGCGPKGWFTATPYGTVDLLPIEASLQVMNQYKAMIFLGWNTYNEADFKRIHDFVFQGGTLLLSAAHLNEELLPNTPTRLPAQDKVVRSLLGDDYRQWTKKTIVKLGEGKIIYFPQAAYPAEDSIIKEYESEMHTVAKETLSDEAGKGWIHADEKVGFTVWDQANHRTIYLLNADWQSNNETQKATFCYGKNEFPIEIRRYHIETIHCAENLAVRPLANTTDVLAMKHTGKEWKITVQTTGPDSIQCMKAAGGEPTLIRIDGAGIHELRLAE